MGQRVWGGGRDVHEDPIKPLEHLQLLALLSLLEVQNRPVHCPDPPDQTNPTKRSASPFTVFPEKVWEKKKRGGGTHAKQQSTSKK